MRNKIRRSFLVMGAVAAVVGGALVSPGLAQATECGAGTVYDAATDTCVVAPAPPSGSTGPR
ncbi:hypothetical protein CRI77_20005, partial [Mycolicibacterium duvalii]